MLRNKDLLKDYTFADHEGVSSKHIPVKDIHNLINQVPVYENTVIYSHFFHEEKCILGDNQCDYFGYRDKIFEITNLISLVHPLVLDKVYRLTKKAFDTIYATPEHIYSFKFNISYRIKTKNNKYIRILRETTPLLADKQRKLICNLSRCTDISQPGHHNEIKAWINLPNKVIDISNELNNILSKREKEILCYLSRGFSSKKISELLFISKLTVDKHRANMLRKAGVTNTSELIKFAIDKGIIGF